MAKLKSKHKKRLAGAALLLWLVGILFPMAWASRSHSAWNVWFNRIFAPTWVHVAMHAALYAVLALGLGWVFGKRLHRAWLWVILLIVAFAQEGLQLWGAARMPGWGEVFDLLVDVGGAAIGLLVWRCFLRGRQAVKNKEVRDE